MADLSGLHNCFTGRENKLSSLHLASLWPHASLRYRIRFNINPEKHLFHILLLPLQNLIKILICHINQTEFNVAMKCKLLHPIGVSLCFKLKWFPTPLSKLTFIRSFDSQHLLPFIVTIFSENYHLLLLPISPCHLKHLYSFMHLRKHLGIVRDTEILQSMSHSPVLRT